MMRQKTILITGASRGIGAETARLFAREGWAVGLNYNLSEDKAMALTQELRAEGCTVLPIKADVRDPAQVQKMVDIVLENFCQLDTLLCNAGECIPGLFTDISYEDWRGLFAVNVDGIYHCCQAVLPHFINRKEGNIITTSSIWGMVGGSCEVAYSATKGAIIAMTKALAKELAPSNIRVNCVAPGAIETEMMDFLSDQDRDIICEMTPLGRVGISKDVAQTSLFLASDNSSFYTGQVFSPNGGFVI